jgi:DNA methylase
MKKKSEQLRLLDETKPVSTSPEVELNKENFLRVLQTLDSLNDHAKLKEAANDLIDVVSGLRSDEADILRFNEDVNSFSVRRDIILSELKQIVDAHTIARSKYYVERLIKGIQKTKTGKINDINLSRWKEYDGIVTDSLWLFDKRDNSGVHLASYWGNFVPQIPHQVLLRYTKKGDWVLDTFVGSGTTLIECRRLGRNGVGVELNAEVARGAQELIEQEPNTRHVTTDVAIGDSRVIDYEAILKQHGIKDVQLLIMHPPYYDIIKFSDDENDLSNATNVEEFLLMFGAIVEKATPVLEKGRYLVLVIGDKYAGGEWIPLGFYCMNEVLKRGYILKSIVVKNFEETRGKRNQKELWRYRALVGGFYVFKHEYVMLFKKT